MSSISIADAASLIQREALLLDANQFAEWLDLYAPDAVYQMPSGYLAASDAGSGLHTILLSRDRMQDYVRRMSSSHAVVANPPPRAVRLLSSPLPDGDGKFLVAWNLHLVRNETSSLFAGRAEYEIVPVAGEPKIRRKTVWVANDTFPTGYMPLI